MSPRPIVCTANLLLRGLLSARRSPNRDHLGAVQIDAAVTIHWLSHIALVLCCASLLNSSDISRADGNSNNNNDRRPRVLARRCCVVFGFETRADVVAGGLMGSICVRREGERAQHSPVSGVRSLDNCFLAGGVRMRPPTRARPNRTEPIDSHRRESRAARSTARRRPDSGRGSDALGRGSRRSRHSLSATHNHFRPSALNYIRPSPKQAVNCSCPHLA